MIRIRTKQASAVALFVISVGTGAYYLSTSATSIKDTAAIWIKSAVSSISNRPDAAAGEAVASKVRDDLGKSPSSAQVILAPVSSDCDQVSQLAPGTALVGDRLAIRFFEREAVQPAVGVVDTPSHYFERLDLSGTYEVDAGGEISLPLVGRVKAEGRSIACVEKVIAARHEETFSAPASVSAAFASRAPVVVTGAVRAEGTYTYAAGMTLRHVLALAGASSQRGHATDIPLLARKAELDALRAGSRLKMLALASARAGSTTMTMSAADHAHFVATLGAERLESEAANLRARVGAYNREQRERTARTERDRVRTGVLIDEKARLEQDVTDKRTSVKNLRELIARGIAPVSRLSAEEAILATLERALFDIKVELLQAETRLEDDVRALNTLADENEQARASEIRDLAEEAGSIDAQLAAIQIQLGAESLMSLLADGASSVVAPLYTLVRTTSKGTARSEADPDSLILPGDIVEVGASGEFVSSRY